MQPWTRGAHRGATISDRLKGDDREREVAGPRFTSLGATVRPTWLADVDLRNMADGPCQRFSFLSAQTRPDRDVFDRLRFWASDARGRRRDALAERCGALATQPGVHGDVALLADVIARIERDWWRTSWRRPDV